MIGKEGGDPGKCRVLESKSRFFYRVEGFDDVSDSLVSKTVRKYISVVLSHSVCGT